MASAQLRMARRGGRRSPLPQAPEVDAVGYDELWSDADEDEADKMSDGEEDGFERAVMASLSKAGSGIPFTKEHLRNPTQENSKVHQSARELLDAALAEPLVHRNELLMPGASIGRKLNMRFLSMGKCIHGGTYHLSNGKDGRSVHMQNRKEDPKYEYVEGTVAFNHSMASSEALGIIDQTFVQLKELDGVKMEEVDLREMDISQAAQLEKEEGNLAFIPRAVIHSMKSDVDDVIGGADRAKGVYNAFMLNCIETAQAELYARREVPGVSSPEALAARQDEHLHFNGMPWVTDADRLANTELRDLFKKLEEYFGADWLKEHDFTDLSSLEVQREPLATEDEGDSAPGEDVVVTFKDGSILVVDSSWAPKLGHPDVAATVLFYDNVVFDVKESNELGLWRNAFADLCKKDAKGRAYNPKDGFTARQRDRARMVRRLRLRRLKARGGIGIFDVCNEAYRDVRYNFLDELENEGFGKDPIFQFLNCSFYCMEKDGAIPRAPDAAMLSRRAEKAVVDVLYAGVEEVQRPSLGKRTRDDDDDGPKSTIDKKNGASQSMLELAERLGNAAVVMQSGLAVLSSPDAAQKDKREALVQLKTAVLPLLVAGSKIAKNSAIASSAMASMEYAYNRQSRRQKNEVIDPRSAKPAAVQMIEHSVGKFQADLARPKKGASKKEPPKKQPPKKKRPVPRIPLDEPANGFEYTKAEAVVQLKKTTKGSTQRKMMMEDMIELQFVNCGARNLQILMKADESGYQFADVPWNSRGNPSYLTDADINEFVDKCRTGGTGLTYDKLSLKKFIVSKRTKHFEDKGLSPVGIEDKICAKTLRNYMASIAVHPEMHAVKKSNPRTEARIVAGNSVRGRAATLFTIAVANIIVLDEPVPAIQEEMKTLTKDQRLLCDLVSAANNNRPVSPVHPGLFCSVDDTTNYDVMGKWEEPQTLRLVHTDGYRKRGTHSLHHAEKNGMHAGMRFKQTHCMTALGTCAPILITISGLTEKEMPNRDFIPIRVEGLVPGGNGVSVTNTEAGYVLFMRGERGMDERRFHFYRDHILVPFIIASREKYFPGWSEREVQDLFRAVVFSDGDMAEIKSSTADIEVWDDNGILRCKHNPAGSIIDQPADTGDVFKTEKRVKRTITVSNLPSDMCPIRNVLIDAMDELRRAGDLVLKSTKDKLVKDYVPSVSLSLTESCLPKRSKKGFVASGYADEQYGRYPVMSTILGACKTGITKEEVTSIVTNFKVGYDETCAKGMIYEALYDSVFRLRRDTNPRGEEVSRDFAITSEHRQRGKIMNVKYQNDLRMAANHTHVVASALSFEDEVKKLEEEVEKLRKIRISILEKNPVGSNPEPSLSLEALNKTSVADLTFFAFAHNVVKYKNEVPGTRGRLEDARHGVNNTLTRYCFDSQQKPNLIEKKLEELYQQGPPGEGGEQPPSAASSSTARPNIRIINVAVSKTDPIPSSQIVADPSKVALARSFVDPDGRSQPFSVDDSIGKRTDLLTKKMRERLVSQTPYEIKDKSKRQHWGMQLLDKNMPVIAALLTLAGHTAPDIAPLGKGDCILAPSPNQFVPSANLDDRSGVVVYFDGNKHAWVGSDLALQETFERRLSTHKERSSASAPSAPFHIHYPPRDSGRATANRRRGLFENLQPCTVMYTGANSEAPAGDFIGKDYSNGGLFFFDEEDAKRISENVHAATESGKFHAVASYLLLLGYDIAIAPSKNERVVPWQQLLQMMTASPVTNSPTSAEEPLEGSSAPPPAGPDGE